MNCKHTLAQAALAGAAVACCVGALHAQTPGITRTVVAKADVSAPNHEAVIARVELLPGGVAAWHTHPGDEMSYVIDGEITVLIAGQPPHKYAAGSGFVIPAGTVHSARNEGTTPVHLAGVYYIEKGKPLASPAPEPARK